VAVASQPEYHSFISGTTTEESHDDHIRDVVLLRRAQVLVLVRMHRRPMLQRVQRMQLLRVIA
jgi:hypothetical protein